MKLRNLEKRHFSVMFFAGILLAFCGILSAQDQGKRVLPETALPDQVIRAILNEVSGELPFTNEVSMAGYSRIRKDREFNGHFHEAEFLAEQMKEYGIDDVSLEVLGNDDPKRTIWLGLEAELWMTSPEEKRLSRLIENPALMARNCEEGEWEGELVYIDRRDVWKLNDLDLKNKIILTPEHSGYFRQAIEKGALGVISSATPKSDTDPTAVQFDVLIEKPKQKVFYFNIWRGLMEDLRDRLFRGEKIVIKAKTRTTEKPSKMEAVFGAIRGTSPEKKGFLFTAHLFEGIIKQGANDNVSGCVTLAEIARTMARLIKDGKIERPERSMYFLMSQEGSGTTAFLRKHPEIADNLFGVINMDMVGENLEANKAFFNIEVPIFSKMTFIEGVTRGFAEFVFQANQERYADRVQDAHVSFPMPIMEKNGSDQPFRYTVSPFTGGSDHVDFLYADTGVPAFSYNVWPDLWYHTDGDRPDKTDPTQLKRVAFIGCATALAVCSGKPDVLERIIRLAGKDREAFMGTAAARAMREVSALNTSDGGAAFRNGSMYIRQSAALSGSALRGIGELVAGKKGLDGFLKATIARLSGLKDYYEIQLTEQYRTIAALRGFPAAFAKPSAAEVKLKGIIPRKINPLKVTDSFPFNAVFKTLEKDQSLAMGIYTKYGFSYYIQIFISADGKRNLAEIHDMLGLEFTPVDPEVFLKHVQMLEDGGLITTKPDRTGKA